MNHRVYVPTLDELTHPYMQLEQRAAQHPNRVYLVQPKKNQVVRYTWSEILLLVNSVASALRNLGVEPHDRVAILAKNSAEWFIADLAIMRAGAISVPIFSTASSATINYCLAHSSAKVMFIGKLDTPEQQLQGLPESVTTIGFDYPEVVAQKRWIEVCSTPVRNDLSINAMTDTATIIYTSGSTGQPKGVVHSYQSLSWAAYACTFTFGYGADDRMISYLPLAHITERCLLYVASLYSGMTVYFVDSLNSFNQDIVRCQPTVFVSVPRLWVKFQQGILTKLPQPILNTLLSLPLIRTLIKKKIKKQLGLSATRLFASGSAPIAPAILRWFERIDMPICEGWGLTENGAYSSANLPFRSDKVGSIGRSYFGVDVRVADDGELQCKSPANLVEYYRDDELSRGVFTSDGYLRTGDKGYIDEEGYIYITGRLKDIFKTSKGKYVAPAPIEFRLMENSYIEQACVNGNQLAAPVALVVLSEMGRLADKSEVTQSLKELLQLVNQRLETHERLQALLVTVEDWTIENGLLTPTLKIKRHEIEQRFAALLHDRHRSGVHWVDELKA